MLDLEEPPAPPFTPQSGHHPRSPNSPGSESSYQSTRSLSTGVVSPHGLRRTSFPASSYRASSILETGSAIPLQFSAPDEPREIQIRRARDSIVGMSSVLSDMKSQLDSVRRASTTSEPPLESTSPNVSAKDRAADRAARIKALGAPWMPQQEAQPPFPSPHGPPPSFRAPLSPLSPPQKPSQLQGRARGDSPIDTESFTTAEEQMSDEDPNRAMPTLPRLSSSNWRDMLSPSPPKKVDPHRRTSSALRLAALGSDDDDDNDDEDSKTYDDTSDHRNSVGDETPEVYGVQEAVRMRKVRQVPTVLEVPAPVAEEARARETRASYDATSMPGLDMTPSTPPVPPRHGERTSSRQHHRYHSLGDSSMNQHDGKSPSTHHDRSFSLPQSRTQAKSSQPTPYTTPSSQMKPRTQARPLSLPEFPTVYNHPNFQISPQAPLQAPSQAPLQAQSQAPSQAPSQAQQHTHPRSTAQMAHTQPSDPQPSDPQPSRSQSSHPRSHLHHRNKSGTNDATRKRNFTKKSIADLVQTAPANHVYDLDEIKLPGPERRLLEKFIDSLSKLSIEIQMDEGKREEGRRRLNNALRALEGWI